MHPDEPRYKLTTAAFFLVVLLRKLKILPETYQTTGINSFVARNRSKLESP